MKNWFIFLVPLLIGCSGAKNETCVFESQNFPIQPLRFSNKHGLEAKIIWDSNKSIQFSILSFDNNTSVQFSGSANVSDTIHCVDIQKYVINENVPIDSLFFNRKDSTLAISLKKTYSQYSELLTSSYFPLIKE